MSKRSKAAAIGVRLTGYIKPYVRMTRRGKWVSKHAQEYQDSQAALKHQILEQLQEKGYRTDQMPVFPGGRPLRAMLIICTTAGLHKKDLDNQVKALLDAAQGLLFANDLWIDSISAERSLGSEELAELFIVPMSKNQ